MITSTQIIYTLIIHILLFFLVLSTIYTDLAYKKIFNWQTYPCLAIGLFTHCFLGGFNGFLGSLTGLILGALPLFVLFFIGGMGAGDVKLLAAIGALKGYQFSLYTLFYSALVGGGMAFIFILWNGTVKKTISNLFLLIRHPIKGISEIEDSEQQYIPFGCAISLGCIWAFLVT